MAQRRAQVSLAAGVLTLMSLLGASMAAAEEPAPFPALAPDGEPLRAAFNRDAARVRLLLFVDPT
ncbi:MAG: hypothetical protein ACRD4D_02410 [Candidatus Acidiferrales bacterium]